MLRLNWKEWSFSYYFFLILETCFCCNINPSYLPFEEENTAKQSPTENGELSIPLDPNPLLVSMFGLKLENEEKLPTLFCKCHTLKKENNWANCPEAMNPKSTEMQSQLSQQVSSLVYKKGACVFWKILIQNYYPYFFTTLHGLVYSRNVLYGL